MTDHATTAGSRATLAGTATSPGVAAAAVVAAAVAAAIVVAAAATTTVVAAATTTAVAATATAEVAVAGTVETAETAGVTADTTPTNCPNMASHPSQPLSGCVSKEKKCRRAKSAAV
mmetsp:Transcript_14442/g.41016  ORF Transcript_14442/g.41016 Transcript_14442/m.41016 type:complete len:117 (-) Transcript_14442:154-504(-)